MVGNFRIVWDRKALDSLKEIMKYLARYSDQAPRIVKDAVLGRLDSIRTNPLICEPDKLKDPADREYRAFVVFSYRVTYQVKSKEREIRVLRIRHTSREPLGY